MITLKPCFPIWFIIATYIFFLLLFTSSTEHDCYCFVESSKNNTVIIDNQLIKCLRRKNVSISPLMEISCQRINTFIRIGPVVVNNTNILVPSTSQKPSMDIAPWAFSDLFMEDTVETLQLDLTLQHGGLNALSLAGIIGLKRFLARTSTLNWDSCSFANLHELQEITLNCKANYTNFLTLGPSITVVRFVGCQAIHSQFHCIQCQQNPDMNVIRILPGPPLRQNLIKFSQFKNTLNTSNIKDNFKPNESYLQVGKCIPDICSDDMLCRTNVALQKARAQQQVRPRIIKTEQTPIANLDPEVKQSTSEQINSTVPVTALPISPRSTHSQLTPSHKIWIVTSILFIILFALFMLCTLITVNHHHRKQRRRINFRREKQLRSCKPRSLPNGIITHDLLKKSKESTEIELPDII